LVEESRAVWVVAIVPVGRVGVPVKVGEANGAKPEMLAPAGIVTVPVKVGLANGARLVSVAWTWSARAYLSEVPTAAVPLLAGVVEDA
jgi:hypothetical protein